MGAGCLPCLRSLSAAPAPPSALFFSPFPSRPCHGRFLWPPLSCLRHCQVRWHDTSSPSADFVHRTFHCDLCVDPGCSGPRWAQIMFSWPVIPNLRIALTEGFGLVREEGKGTGCFSEILLLGFPATLFDEIPCPNNMMGSGVPRTLLGDQKPFCLSSVTLNKSSLSQPTSDWCVTLLWPNIPLFPGVVVFELTAGCGLAGMSHPLATAVWASARQQWAGPWLHH